MHVCVLSYSIAVKSYKTRLKEDKNLVHQQQKSHSPRKKIYNWRNRRHTVKQVPVQIWGQTKKSLLNFSDFKSPLQVKTSLQDNSAKKSISLQTNSVHKHPQLGSQVTELVMICAHQGPPRMLRFHVQLAPNKLTQFSRQLSTSSTFTTELINAWKVNVIICSNARAICDKIARLLKGSSS